MRADALANREALLAAARHLYSSRGMTVPYSQIAAEAGVGIATLYRHFPTPDDLALGLFVQVLERIRDICARRRGELAAGDETGWTGFVADLVALEMGALVPQLVAGRGLGDLPPQAMAIRESVLADVGEVLRLAKAAGLVREEVTPLYFQAGLGALTRPLPEAVAATVPDLRAWLVEVFVAGLRP